MQSESVSYTVKLLNVDLEVRVNFLTFGEIELHMEQL